MNYFKPFQRGVFLVCALLLPPGSASTAESTRQNYSIVDLAIINPSVSAVNNRGEIATSVRKVDSAGSLSWQAVIWRRGELIALPSVLGQPDTVVVGLNDRGQVVGIGFNAATGTPAHALLWEDGNVTDLSDATATQPLPIAFVGAINNHGIIAGQSFVQLPSGLGTVAIILDGDTIDSLGWLSPLLSTNPHYSVAQHINNKGTVVGESDTDADRFRHAFVWRDGLMTDLGLPFGLTSGATYVRGINDKDEIIGEYQGVQASSYVIPLLWKDGHEPIDLGGLSASGLSAVFGLNNRGQVVGQTDSGASSSPTSLRPWLWEDGYIADLNDLVTPRDSLRPYVTLLAAYSINDKGQIAILGYDYRDGPCVDYRSCPTRMYLLNPADR